ncbi:hypothetical protein AQ490_15410 [Wenjunlia vitaminophila]|uniref:Uncharacterized protein n=1 Tax=Wenjunlia vitaminophila TaxID=76728 RepID=A0A0T6LWN2_WENVI|nr:hypothetical protein [Wenjunlia vitaminophila]KRV50468.1 hypothetical protein AQ490_15410 [Wenjunlia vitaminophila]
MAGSTGGPEHAPDTPDEVRRLAGSGPRAPVTDPTVGVPLRPTWQGAPRHRLVTIGDSLTHGFQSGAVFATDLSYPAIIAHELGWSEHFRRPNYPGLGGLPLNIEVLLRDLERRYGAELDWWEAPGAVFHARDLMDRVEDYWERGPGTVRPLTQGINHNLGIYGWDLRDVLDRTAKSCADELRRPKDHLLRQVIEHNNARAALRVLPSMTPEERSLTVPAAAAQLGEEVGGPGGDPDHGVETLVVFLGANNALSAVSQLKVVWSDDGYDDLERKRDFTVWRPSHFRAELAELAAQVLAIRARHVIWCTVPHVTIAPIARGVRAKVRPGSRYFPYYTRPWISDDDFDPDQDPHLTGAQARDIDLAVDQYNEDITAVVRAARREGRDWLLLDVAGVLDRLACRRYLEDPLARPDWWEPYPLPPEVAALDPPPDSRFLSVDGGRRCRGGLFSLDGVHPTTVGYGLIAQELINVMQGAGVEFRRPDGRTPRTAPVTVDFRRLIRRDTLINRPPANLDSSLSVLAWGDEVLDLFRRTLRFRF